MKPKDLFFVVGFVVLHHIFGPFSLIYLGTGKGTFFDVLLVLAKKVDVVKIAFLCPLPL